MESTSAQVWNGVLQTAEDVIQWQEGPSPEFDDDSFLAGVRTVLFDFGPIGASVVSDRLRHFRTVLTLSPY
jgi:hypothetical protein